MWPHADTRTASGLRSRRLPGSVADSSSRALNSWPLPSVGPTRGSPRRVIVPLALSGLIAVCLVGVVAGLPVHLALGAGAAAVLFISSVWSSRVGITSMIIACTVFQRDELFATSLPMMGGGLKPTDLLLLATLAGWAHRQITRRHDFRSVRLGVLVPSVAFVGWATMAALYGMGRGAFYKDSLLELRPLLQYLLVLPIVTEFKGDDIRRISRIFLAAAVLVAGKAIYLYSTDQGTYAAYAGGSIRVTGVNFSVLMIAAMLGLALASRPARLRALHLGVVLAALGGLAVTLQRAAFVAMPLSVLGMALLLPRQLRLRLGNSVALGGLLLFLGIGLASVSTDRSAGLVNAVTGRVASIAEFSSDVSAQHRFREWRAALDIVRLHPFTGGGLGTRVGFYSPMYGSLRQQMGYWSEDIYMHNSYMWIVTKMGIIGLLLFLVVLAVGGRELARYWRAPGAAQQPALLAGLGGVLMVFVISAVFGPMFNQDESASIVAFTLGGICVLSPPIRPGRLAA